ncbi:MAG: response regulator transcription factor [Euzebyaceae bacterium]|nr:response regulator transcription factor [Euzebyaceae bacterium]
MARVLLVEDDDAIAVPLERALRRDEHDVVRTASGEEAVQLVLTDPPDLLLLDLGLPDLDGLEVCRRIREAGSLVVVMMLTARGDELDRVVGLDVGADDYLSKPFSLAELSARMRALLRRAGPAAPPAKDRRPLRVDLGARRVFLDGEEVALTVKEFDLLAVLHRQLGQVVTREQLMDQVWDEHWFGSTKTLDVTVARLRAKLVRSGGPVRLATTRGVGFRLEVGAPDA